MKDVLSCTSATCCVSVEGPGLLGLGYEVEDMKPDNGACLRQTKMYTLTYLHLSTNIASDSAHLHVGAHIFFYIFLYLFILFVDLFLYIHNGLLGSLEAQCTTDCEWCQQLPSWTPALDSGSSRNQGPF